MENNWKFIHNGDGWWLQITNVKQLKEYCKLTENVFSRALNDAITYDKNQKEGKPRDTHNENTLAVVVGQLAYINEISLFESSCNLAYAMHNTYYKCLEDRGFVNINTVGGCNCFDFPIKAVEYRERPIFPNYKKSDIRIKTFKYEELKYASPDDYTHPDDYNYHYYAYIGNIQLHDGDKMKWDTEEEARAFAEKFIGV